MTLAAENFKPYEYAKITATTASANVAFGARGGDALRIYNSGTSIVFCKWGIGTQVVTSTTGYAVGPGHKEFPGADAPGNVAVIAAAGTADVYLARGKGNVPYKVFSPADYANLGYWFDALDSSVPATGSRLPSWKDKSGNGRDAPAANVSFPPLVVAGAINGRTAIQFDDAGTATVLSAPHVTWTTGYQMFAVIQRVTDVGASEHVCGPYVAVDPQREARLLILASDVLQMTASTTGAAAGLVSANSIGTLVVGTPYIIEGFADTAAAVVGESVNNADTVTQGVFNAHVDSAVAFNIGGRNAAAEPYAGYIGEIIVYTSILSAGQRLQVLKYLAARWGITIA